MTQAERSAIEMDKCNRSLHLLYFCLVFFVLFQWAPEETSTPIKPEFAQQSQTRRDDVQVKKICCIHSSVSIVEVSINQK